MPKEAFPEDGRRGKVKPEDCPKLDECYKIKMVLGEILDVG